MSDETRHDCIVIGTGVAGLSAAKLVLQSGLSAATIEGQMFGGLILNVNELDGEVQGSGSEFAANLMDEVTDLGAENLAAIVSGIERDGDGLVVTSDAGRHHARAVIVATGATLQKLGVPGEEEFEYKGVSHCADCDGPMLHGQDAVVVGGGDSALQSALVLAGYCRAVHLVHRQESFRGQPHLADLAMGTSNIRLHRPCVVEAITGGDGVEAVRVRNLQDGTSGAIPCGGVFVFVGLRPAADFLPAEVGRDAAGFVLTGEDRATALPGVYAAGAVRAGCGGSVAAAIADGEAAARAACAGLARRGAPTSAGNHQP